MNMKYALWVICLLLDTSVYSQTITKIESVQSLYIEVYKDNELMGSATGFIIRPKGISYIVTNYHVVTNKRADNGCWVDSSKKFSPNKIAIFHNSNRLGIYNVKYENLIDENGNPRGYYKKLNNNEMVDVVEIPLSDTNNVAIYPVNYKSCFSDTTVAITPTSLVFVLGFPAGKHSDPFMPIWKSGTIASEPNINQQNKPIMFVDINGIGGMSGSPVYFIANQTTNKEGGFVISNSPISIFLGVFSHGISNIYGALWKAKYLSQMFDELP